MSKEGYNCELNVKGMHCAACELLIEDELSEIDGVQLVDAKLGSNKVYLRTTRDVSIDELNAKVKAHGYTIVADAAIAKEKLNIKELGLSFAIAALLFILFLLLQKTGLINFNSSEEITFPFVFIIGVIASLSTCMAVVGGLVLSISTNYSKEHATVPMLSFHVSRLISFFILGGIMGLIGSAATLTPTSSFILNVILFVVMLIMSFNLLGIFTNSQKFQLKMPKFVGKKILNIQNTNNYLTPVLLGASTFFLPCGFTQSMQLYSVTTGNALNGALTMFVFALGTLPVLALISFASSKLSRIKNSGLFYKTSGFLIIFFALFNLVAALVAVGLIAPIFNL